MNFFEEQLEAKKKSKALIFLFIGGVLAIIIAIHLLVSFFWIFAQGSEMKEFVSPMNTAEIILNWKSFLTTAFITIFVIGASSLYKLHSLRGGGMQVAINLGGRLVPVESDDPSERRLLNVVEEMAIASGIPVPPVYVLEEEAINAFAAGNSINDAVIGITRGALKLLNRDELQGVIAHEFSHILHGDMRINIRLIGILHGILVLSIIGRVLMRMGAGSSHRRHYGSNNKRDSSLPLVAGGLGLLLIGWIGVLCGRLIKAAISRQREFLADASAVQYTRNPEGIGSALKKLGGWVSGSNIEHPRAEEMSHLFFGNALGLSFAPLFATHPPLLDRIQKIDPSFSGEFPEVQYQSDGEELHSGFAGRTTVDQSSPAPSNATDTIGEISLEHLEHSKKLLAEIPLRIHKDIHSLLGAQAITLCLLISGEDDVRERQMKGLEEKANKALYSQIKLSYDVLKSCEHMDLLRLPLIDLALPALGQLNKSERDTFLSLARILVIADDQVSLFEYMLHHILKRHLKGDIQSTQKESLSENKFKEMAQALLSVTAHISIRSNQRKTTDQVRTAYNTGKGIIQADLPAEPLDVGEDILPIIDQSLTSLGQASWTQKEELLRALEAIILHDDHVLIREAEFFRVIADALGCPVPPILKAAHG